MANVDFGYDPAYVKLKEIKEEAISLGVPESILNGLQYAIDHFQRREQFCEKMSSPSSDSVNDIIKATKEHPWKQLYEEGKATVSLGVRMMSGHLEGDVLKCLISASRARRVLEIGMFTGCAALGMAEVLPEDGKVVSCELDQYVCNLARSLMDKSPHGKKVEIRQGYALETMRILVDEGQKFDFIFVDAVKSEYIDYVKMCVESLLATGGTIAVDNALHFGKPYKDGVPEDEALTRFNKWILTRDDIFHVMMPIRDGIMLIRRKADMVNN